MQTSYSNFLIRILVFSSLIFTAGFATAQEAAVYNINQYNGLSTNHVYSSHIDRLGYMWLCTTDGVYRYNGYTLQRYDYKDGLANTDVWDMYEDKDGRIWLMSIASGIGYIQNNVYHPAVILNDSISEKIYPDAFIETDSLIFFLLKFYSKTDVVYGIIRNDTLELRKLPFDFIGFLIYLTRDRVIIATDTSLRYYPTHELIHDNKLTTAVDSTKPLINIGRDLLENRILKTHRNISYFSDTKTDSAYFYDLLKNTVDTVIVNKTLKEKIIHVQSYKEDLFLLLTKYNAYRFNTSNKTIDTIPLTYFSANNPKKYNAIFFITDKLWGQCLSTPDEGLYINYNTDNRFQPVDISLTDYTYINLLNDSTGYWWNDDENRLITVTNGKILKSHYLPAKFIVAQVIPFNHEKSLLIGTPTIYWWYNNGTIRNFIDTDSLIFNGVSYEVDNRFTYFLKSNTQCAVVDDTNYIVLGTSFLGALHANFDRKENKINVNTIESEKYEGLLYYPQLGCYIIYNSDKVLLYNTSTRKKTVISKKMLESLHISSIEKIVADNHGHLFIKDYDKIIMFNPLNGEIEPLLTNYNFKGSFISTAGNTLTIAGIFGVIHCNTTAQGKLINVNTYPNTKTLLYKYIYDAQFSKNNVLLKTDNGVYLVKTDSTGIPANNSYKLIVTNNSVLHNISTNDTLLVYPGTEALGVDVIKPTGTGNLNIEYSINESAFSNTGYQIILPTLKPGSYNTVSIVASDDSWRSKPLRFTIYIQPEWWQTHTATNVIIIISVLFLIGFTYLIIITTRRIVNSNNEKRSQRRELELKSIYSQINPHFIFNSLSTAQYFVKKNKTKEAFEHINQFSDLLRSYIKSSRAKYISIAEEIDNLENYLQLQLTRFEDKFEYKIEVDKAVNPAKVKIPSLLLQPLVENALNHGIFHSDNNGLLNISFKLDTQGGNTLICIVDDNGIGRQKSKELRGKIIRKADSYGTILIKELIDTFNKYEKINIEIEYIDKQLPYSGTTVVIRIRNYEEIL